MPPTPMARMSRMKPQRWTMNDPTGDKWVVSIQPRGMPEALGFDLAWLVGVFIGGVFFNEQYKILVHRFHPKRTKPLGRFDWTYWSIKGFRSYEAADAAARLFVQQIEGGTWSGGAA